jgi:hypothetical protein
MGCFHPNNAAKLPCLWCILVQDNLHSERGDQLLAAATSLVVVMSDRYPALASVRPLMALACAEAGSAHPQSGRLFTAVRARLTEAGEAGRGAPGSDQHRTWLLQQERALATRSCASLACTNLAGDSETSVKGRRCAGCVTVRYCCTECAAADWRRHRPACRLLAAMRAQQ